MQIHYDLLHREALPLYLKFKNNVHLVSYSNKFCKLNRSVYSYISYLLHANRSASTARQAMYCIAGKFSRGKFGNLTLFEYLAKESLAN